LSCCFPLVVCFFVVSCVCFLSYSSVFLFLSLCGLCLASVLLLFAFSCLFPPVFIFLCSACIFFLFLLPPSLFCVDCFFFFSFFGSLFRLVSLFFVLADFSVFFFVCVDFVFLVCVCVFNCVPCSFVYRFFLCPCCFFSFPFLLFLCAFLWPIFFCSLLSFVVCVKGNFVRERAYRLVLRNSSFSFSRHSVTTVCAFFP